MPAGHSISRNAKSLFVATLLMKADWWKYALSSKQGKVAVVRQIQREAHAPYGSAPKNMKAGCQSASEDAMI